LPRDGGPRMGIRPLGGINPVPSMEPPSGGSGLDAAWWNVRREAGPGLAWTLVPLIE